MKVAPKLIFLFKDADGFGTAISDALRPNPNSTLRTLEDSFVLSLDRYGIKDHKASGNMIHFVDEDDHYQVSMLLLQNYEPPVLACALNEVLTSLAGDNSSTMPTLVLPCFVAASKLKLESKNPMRRDKVSLYGVQLGPETDITRALNTKTQQPPSSLQIHHEPLACFLQLARVLKIPTFIILGQSGQSLSHKISEELEVIYEIGEHLATISSLRFFRERITWHPTKASRDSEEEPWRALYG